MKEEAHTFSMSYFRAVCMRAILLLYTACEKLNMCSLSGTFCIIDYWGLPLTEKSRGGWLLAEDSGWRLVEQRHYKTCFSLEKACPLCSSAELQQAHAFEALDLTWKTRRGPHQS